MSQVQFSTTESNLRHIFLGTPHHLLAPCLHEKNPSRVNKGIQVFYLKIDGWWPTTSFQGRLGLSNVCFREQLSHQLAIDWKVNSFCNCEKTVQQKGDPRLPKVVNVQSNKRQQQMRHKTHDLLFPNNTKFISQLEPTFLKFL